MALALLVFSTNFSLSGLSLLHSGYSPLTHNGGLSYSPLLPPMTHLLLDLLGLELVVLFRLPRVRNCYSCPMQNFFRKASEMITYVHYFLQEPFIIEICRKTFAY